MARRPRREEEEYRDYNTSIHTCFNEFIRDKIAQGLNKLSISTYQSSFDYFIDYFKYAGKLDHVEDLNNITYTDIVDWINFMRDTEEYNKYIINTNKRITRKLDKDLSIETINTRLSSMRTFLYWCMEDNRNYIPRRSRFYIDLVSTKHEEQPKNYTKEEIEKLITKPDKKASFVEWRCWAMCCFVLGTGARIGTMIEIRMEDIDWNNCKIEYRHTKNKRRQVVNISPQLLSCLKEYIRMFNLDKGTADNYLFCNVSGEYLRSDTFRHGFIKYAKDRGVSKTSIHGLRHTFAREWFLNGGDVFQLSKILGHSSLTMSQRYMNVFSDEAKERFIDANPLEHLTRKTRGKAIIKKRKKEPPQV